MRFKHSFCQGVIAVIGLSLIALSLMTSGRAEGRLWLSAHINGNAARLAFDTGASHPVLFPRGAARLGISFTNAAGDVRLSPGEVRLGRTEKCELSLGGTVIRGSFRVFDAPNWMRTQADGVLGWQTLRENI